MDSQNKVFGNERVSASAGSGKTFSLTTRFIALACARESGAEPDPFSIVALTFTKKAAGEFLSKILTRLADAALDDRAAKSLAEDLAEAAPHIYKFSPPSREDFERLLAACAKNISRLHLGTIDSFFSSILRRNAGALKIFAPVRIMDAASSEASKLMLDTVSRVMNERAVSDAETEEFAELVKRAAFGNDQKQFRDVIIGAIESAHGAYLALPDLSLWGNWEKSGVARAGAKFDKEKYGALLERLRGSAEGAPQLKSLVDFFENSTATKFGKTSSAVLAQALEAYRRGDLRKMRAYQFKNKTYPFEAADIVCEMLNMLFFEHFSRLCDATKAAGKIAAIYEREYDALIRSKGKITFADLPYILADPRRKIDIEQIEYKLDAKFNHWLFDEFQDTSEIQWLVLKNILEEAIYSPEKSFYFVGDIKQSLYAWRGATPGLFNEIFRAYNRNAPMIRKSKPLTVSWRSGAHVIDAVNKIFGKKDMLARVFTRESAEIFSSEFEPHKSAESLGQKPQMPSYARLALYDGQRSDDDDIYEQCLAIKEILRETEPIKRGITCAILVNKNKDANAVVDFLKDEGFNAEGELSVEIQKDRPVVALFSAILRRLAHPLNTASDAFSKMARIDEFTDGFSDEFVSRARLEIYERGFKKFADKYCAHMSEFFDLKNAAELKWLSDVCLEIDRSGNNSLDDAADAIASAKVSFSANAGAIQVMTIHKSKGLSFGMVIMSAKAQTKARRSVIRVGNSAMIRPTAALAQFDEKLFATEKSKSTEERFETICKLYVAATRPERALYLLAPKVSAVKSPEGDEMHFTQLLLNAFSPEFNSCRKKSEAQDVYDDIVSRGATLEMGDKNWFESFARGHAAPKRGGIAFPEGAEEIEPPVRPVSPSKQNEGGEEAADSAAAEFGRRAHKFFESIATLKTPPDTSGFADSPEFLRGFEALLADPKYRAFFDAPNTIAYNEFPFSAKLGGSVVAGTIDRIVLERGADGAFIAAKILDYKPDADYKKYAPQLNLYKRAAAAIFAISEDKIEVYLAKYMP